MLVYTGKNSYLLPGWRGIGTSGAWVSDMALEPARLAAGPLVGRPADPHYWRRPRGAGHAWLFGAPGLSGLSSLPSVSSSSPFVSAMAAAIAQMEGYNTAGTIAANNNNPGNLRAGAGQVGTANGFAVFATAADGWAALDSQIQYNINQGLTMQQFFGGLAGVYPGYAPSTDSNNPAAYASYVAGQVGVSAAVPLSQLQATYDQLGSTVADTTDLTTAASSAGSDLATAASDASSWVSGLFSDGSGSTIFGLDPVALAAGLGVLGVLVLASR